MKTYFRLSSISIIAGMSFMISLTAEANWLKTDNKNPSTLSQAGAWEREQPGFSEREQTVPENKRDSLPAGVTKEWLNSLRDENGNRIIPASPEQYSPGREQRKRGGPDDPGDAMQQKTFNGFATGDQYGYSVSSAGDVNGDGYSDVIIGAPYNDAAGTDAGRAYIYYGGIIMHTIADVILTGEAAGNNFGISVSGAGDVNSDGYSDVIVGAYGYSANTGRAYIYFGSAVMNNGADVTMTGETAGDNFGFSVSKAGDVNGDGYSDVIAGAWGYSSNTGRAYIYFGGALMNNVADVILTGETAGITFGISVAGAGDVNGDGYSDVITGAYAYSSYTGKAYIYYGGAVMNNVVDIIMTGEATFNYFGFSVSGAGDVNSDGYADVIVGAYGYGSNKGRAYIFYGGLVMNNTADVITNGEAISNFFGYSVSGAGDVNGDGYADVIVGAYKYSSFTGRAYIYFGGTVMNNVADITITGEAANNNFGFSVSGAGDVNGDGYDDVTTGAYGVSSNTGRTYVYTNSITGEDTPVLVLNGEATNNYFGASVAGAGDVNGDGYSDVIVGAEGYNSLTGRAYIYYGGIEMNNVADVILTGDTLYSLFGCSVAAAGDVNGDGYSDVIVGARGFNPPYPGKAFIYYGGSPMNNVADVILTGEAPINFFGSSVSGAGDVNGDGYPDVIVGALGFGSDIGRAYIYFGGAVMNNIADIIMTGESAESLFGSSVSYAGDVNGDGYSDVIVGSYGFNSETGRAYMYYGGAVMNNTADVIMTGEAPNNAFGGSVSAAGDVNGDGYSDVIVGAWKYNLNSGKAYIYFGGSLMDNTADVTFTGGALDSLFGVSVAVAGDVNRDGYSDVIIGSPGYSSAKGRAYIYYGGAFMNNVADVTMTGEAPFNYFGISVSGAGDINGDGYPDVIAGAYGTGRSYIYQSSPLISHGLFNLTMAMEGFYDATIDNMRLSDTARVYFRYSTSPYSIVDSSKGVINKNTLTGTFSIKNAPTGTYYIVVKHRNCIETWSHAPVVYIRNETINYNFTLAQTKAFGNNMKQVDTSPIRFGIFSGDVNQDGTIDLTDLISIYNDSKNFVSGYVRTDVTGDNFVDLSDLLITYNNSINFVSVIRP